MRQCGCLAGFRRVFHCKKTTMFVAGFGMLDEVPTRRVKKAKFAEAEIGVFYDALRNAKLI
jgi:hypothetical protein